MADVDIRPGGGSGGSSVGGGGGGFADDRETSVVTVPASVGSGGGGGTSSLSPGLRGGLNQADLTGHHRSGGPSSAGASAGVVGMPSCAQEGVVVVGPGPSSFRGGYFDFDDSELVPRKSANMTDRVAVPSSEHVAEIVGRQGE